MTRRSPLLWAIVAAALAVPAGLSAQGGTSTFTAAERRRLSRGELVMRRETQQRGELRLIGGTSWQVVDAPPRVVWESVVDTDDYGEFLPEVSESRILRRQPGQRLVFLRHQQGPVEASYAVRIDFLERQRMARFRIDTTRPASIRDGWGFFIVQPFGDDRSMVTFGIMADVGTGVVAGLVRPRVHEWMLRVPQELKKHVERELRAGRG